jgi:signal transduction histidine kinase/CheY-like chemotaxis protein
VSQHVGVVGLLRRLTIVQAMLLVLVLLLSTATVVAYRAADARARSTEETLLNLEVLRSEVLSAETSLRGYLLVGDEGFLGPYRDAAPRIAAALRTLRDSADAGAAEGLDRISSLTTEWRALFAEIVLNRIQEGRREDALDLVESGQGKARVDRVRAEVSLLEQGARAELEDRREFADLVATVGGVLAVAATLAIAVVTIRAQRRLVRNIADPLVGLAATADRFGGGDLEARAVGTGVVEVERVAGAFNLMADRMATTVTDLRALDRLKSEFVSVVSHELRTPLTSIRGSLGLLASGAMGELPPDGAQMLQIAVSNTDRLVRLINDILDLERIESGQEALDLRPVPLSELMLDAAGNVAGSAEGAEVSVEVRPIAATIQADADRIVQALTNLLGNAVKFSEPGGRVLLEAELDGGDAVLRVRDEGRGIPADKLDSIFERFQQVDATDAREKGGTGLGLAIVRSVAERHGGRVEVTSEVGAGSCFSLHLPVGAAMGAHERPMRTGGRAVVVLAEDDDDLSNVLRAMLERHGVLVSVARSADKAVQRCIEEDPDLLVLDVRLARDTTGYEVVRALRQHDAMRTLPTIVYTVSDLTSSQREALRLGETTFVGKGGDIADLEREVVRMLASVA